MIDEELADAIHGVLDQNDDSARRLARAIEWLDVAWRNTSDITPEVRVMALKSGFEVLLNKGDKIWLQRAELSLLLDDTGAPRSARTWNNKRTGQAETRALTDLEWWFTTFTFLRNDIVHGGAVPEAAWFFDDKKHIMLAQRYLLDVVQRKVADTVGDQHLRVSAFRRGLARARTRLQHGTTGNP